MFFLKRYRSYAYKISLAINNIKYGAYLTLSSDRDEITMYHQYGKSQLLLCHLARTKHKILHYPLYIDRYNQTTYIEYKNESYHGCYAEYSIYGKCDLYVSYNNGILHGKSIKVEYSDNYHICISMKYINGYADKVKLLYYSTDQKKINIRYHNIPLTYLHIDNFPISDIRIKTANVSHYYAVENNTPSYEKYIDGVLKYRYIWMGSDVIIHTKKHINNVEIEYNRTNVECLFVSVQNKIDQFSITSKNRLIDYKWQTENGGIKFININLYKAPSLKEYKVIKYEDGEYRKKCIKYR